MKTAVIIYLIANLIVWLLRHINISRQQQLSTSLDSKYPTDQLTLLPRVSVLVAARNESKNIGRCVKSLLRQNYENLEIIAVDDRSEDDTGEILDRLASESAGRLTTLHVESVPDGWLGKPNAMRLGVEHASGDLLCFTDADCFFLCPDTIRIAVAYAMDRKIDLLSVLPALETSSFWEHVLQPVCSAVLMIWFRPEKVNDPTDPIAYANGAFMLFGRETYEAFGGHAAAKDQVNEDMRFAELVKSSGRQLHVVPNRDLYRTRMYEGLYATFKGWSRIFYGCFRRLGRVLIASLMLTLMSLLPYVIFVGGLVIAIIRGWTLSDKGWFVLAWSGLAIVSQMSVITRFYVLMGKRWHRALSYPLGAAVVLMILINSMSKFFGTGIVWRGRQIRTKRLGG